MTGEKACQIATLPHGAKSAELKQTGHWQTGLAVSLSLIPKSIHWSDAEMGLQLYWIQRSVDKTAEQSPLSYLTKDLAVTFTDINTGADGFKLHCMSGRRRTDQTNAAEAHRASCLFC